MEACYFTRTSLQVFFADFDGNFKSTNKNPGSTFTETEHFAVAFGN